MSGSDLSPQQASALVSIVVVPRERFGVATVALDSLLKETAPGYELIYVDAGSPDHVGAQLRQRSRQHGFTLIREDRFLPPPAARNLGRKRATRKYVVFLDNDTLFKPGWLTTLVRCAEETGAALVGPLYMAGPFELGNVHMQGGLWKVEQKNGQGWPSDEYVMTELDYNLVKDQLHRREVDFVEFHCMLARADMLNRIGPFDERLKSSPDHIDLALLLRQIGGRIFSEPAAEMTYLRAFDMELFDLSYFMLRWSPEWNQSSLAAFAAKWNYATKSEFMTWQGRWLDENGARYGLVKLDAAIAQRIVPADSAAIAQTNMALYALMAREGYGQEAIATMDKAYKVAQLLFGHLYRSSGKPFLAHAIGIAAILAIYRQPVDLLRAALLHAVFSHARFPTGVADGQRMDWLRGHVGDDVVRYIEHYRRWQLDPPPPATAEAIMRLPAWDGAALAIAMADAIEDAVDGSLGMLGHDLKDKVAWLDAYDLVAGLIHLPGLAASVRRALGSAPPAWAVAVERRLGFSYWLDGDSGQARAPGDRPGK